MNILIFVSSLNYGGAEKQAVLDANMLSKQHIIFLCTFWSGSLIEQLQPDVKHITFRKTNYFFTALKIVKFIKKNKISIVHSLLFSSIAISALATLFIKVNVIWHFHSHEYDIPFRSRIALKYLAKLKNVKKILFVNKELKVHLSRLYNFPKHKLGVLYNSTQIKTNKTLREDLTKDKTIIGYIGRLIELKRVHYLIELGEFLGKNNIHNFEILIIGDGEERKELEILSQKLNTSYNIKFLGFQSDTEKWYDQFDIFVNPSREECLSMVLIDAGIKGIPSIAFNTGGSDEIIINEKTGYIVYSKQELFDKVKILINNSLLRNQLGMNAIKHCQKKFSQEVHKKQLLEIYQNV